MNIIAMLMGVLAGACSGIQGGINAQLTKYWAKNAVLTSAFSFFVGASTLWLVALILGIPVPPLTDKILWWHWTGGLLGAYYVFALVYLSPRLGASTVVALLLGGQIITAVILDHFGLVGFPIRSINGVRLFGVASLVTGVFLIRKS